MHIFIYPVYIYFYNLHLYRYFWFNIVKYKLYEGRDLVSSVHHCDFVANYHAWYMVETEYPLNE